MIELKTKLSQLYGCDTVKLKKPELQRKLQLLLDLCDCFDKVDIVKLMQVLPNNITFQIQHSVTSKNVLHLSELLKIGEAIAKRKLNENFISKESYTELVVELKQRFIHALFKHQNKPMK